MRHTKPATQYVRCQWCRVETHVNKPACAVCGNKPWTTGYVATVTGSHGEYEYSTLNGRVLTPLDEIPEDYAQDEIIDTTLYTALTGRPIEGGDTVDTIFCDIQTPEDVSDATPEFEPILHAATDRFLDGTDKPLQVRINTRCIPEPLPLEENMSFDRIMREALNKLLPDEPPVPSEYTRSYVGVASVDISYSRSFVNTMVASINTGLVEGLPENWVGFLELIQGVNAQENLKP